MSEHHVSNPAPAALAATELAPDLTARDELLELAERSAGIGVWDMDMRTQCVRGTPQFFRNLGIAPRNERVPIQDIRALRHPQDTANVVRSFQEAAASGAETFETEYRIVRPDGEVRWIFGRGRIFRDEHGEPVRYSGVDIDITDRKRAEEALLESEERYRSLVENASDLVFTLDLDFNLRSANPSVMRFLGYSIDEIVGRPLHAFVPKEQLAKHREMLTKKISGDAEETRYEMQVIGRDGRIRILETSSRLSFDRLGNPNGTHAIARDITERKQYEDHLALTTKELSHRTKNVLAVVQAIVHQIGKRSSTFADFEARLIGCVAALAHSHDLLVEHGWHGASLDELIRRQLSPFGIEQTRISVEGSSVFLDPVATQLFGLALHELATNALKHGSLSTAEGLVSIGWLMEDQKLKFVWQESGGPPVGTPTRRGFGSTVLERMVSTDGKAMLDFLPTGVRWRLEIADFHVL